MRKIPVSSLRLSLHLRGVCFWRAALRPQSSPLEMQSSLLETPRASLAEQNSLRRLRLHFGWGKQQGLAWKNAVWTSQAAPKKHRFTFQPHIAERLRRGIKRAISLISWWQAKETSLILSLFVRFFVILHKETKYHL